MNEIPSEHAEQVALVKKLKSENIFVASKRAEVDP